MTLQTNDDRRIDAATIYHHRETAEGSAILAANDGDGLSCLDTLTRLDKILRIVAINGL